MGLHNQSAFRRILMYGGASSASSAAALLAAYGGEGLAIDFKELSLAIIDSGTPANDFDGDPNDSLTYASPSSKLILAVSGLYEAGTTLRTVYDTNGTALGLLAEEERTNDGPPSDFSSGWGYQLTNSQTTGQTDAKGTSTAVRLDMTASEVAAGFYFLSGMTGSADRAFSFLARMVSGTGYARCLMYNATDGQIDGADVAINATTWTRVSHVFTPTVTSSNFYICNGSDAAARVFDVCFPVNSEGSYYTSPIITAGAPVTRAADDISLSLSDMSSLGSAYTIAVKYQPTSAASENRVLRLDDGTANEIVAIGNTSGGAGAVWITDGGAAQTAPLTDGTITSSAFHTLAISVEANNVRLVVNGGTQVQDTSVTLPSPTTLRLMPVGSGIIDSVLVIPGASTESVLQGIFA